MSFLKSWMQKIGLVPKIFWGISVLLFLAGLLIGHTGSSPKSGVGTAESVAQTDTQKVQWWTCSMHPQIKLPAPGKCPICFMDLIPLVTGESEEGPRTLKMSDDAVKLAEIVTAPVHRGNAIMKITLPGKIQADERRVKTITAWAPGRLEKLFVDFTGQAVKQGDPLVELYSPELYAAQEELLQALRQTGKSSGILADAAREKLAQLGLTNAQIMDIEKKGAASDRLTIVSPISGIVIHKSALEGEYVDKGSEIYTIADLSSVWAVLDAYEKDIGFLKVGQSVKFEAEALPGTEFTARIAFIDPTLNDETRSVAVRLDVSNAKRLLKPAMFIRARIEVPPGGMKQPLLIPASAPLITGKRAVVYVQKPGMESPVFEGRDVVLGPKVGDQYVVESGLMEGEAVVVKGNFKIDSELQIHAKPSMMNPAMDTSMSGHQDSGAGMPSMTHPSASPEMEMKSPPSSGVLKSLVPIYDAYLAAQHALAQDDFKSARESLIKLRTSLRSSDSGLPSPEKWRAIRDNLLGLTEHAPHWQNIESVRKAFGPISEQMIRMEKAFGHPNLEPLYQVHCPMAFDNQGADWLQPDSTVANPYFGSQMPRCGTIQEKFEPRSH